MSTASEPVIAVACGLPRPTWRGRVHTYAFMAAIPAAAILLLATNNANERVGVGIYWVSLAAVFGVSAAYHRLAITDKAQKIMRKADHATVFVKIAGTYTPICLVALPRNWGIPILITVWSIAAVGILVKLLAPARFIRWSSPLYLAIGWVAIVALPTLARNLTMVELGLIIGGGVVYSVGAILFWMRRPDPAPRTFGYHEVWHVMTVVASAFHFGAIVLLTTTTA
jgi:hemolysin III